MRRPADLDDASAGPRESRSAPDTTPADGRRNERAASGAPPRRFSAAIGVTAATALLALVSGAIGLVFDLWPELRPDPRTELGSDASVVAIERNVTRDEYLRRRYPSRGDYHRRRREEITLARGQVAGLRLHGELAYVRVKLHGYKGNRVLVQWSIYDARRQTRLTQANSESRWTGDAPSDQFIDEIWLEPVFGRHRRYFVRIEVREPSGVLLALADSRPFAGLNAA